MPYYFASAQYRFNIDATQKVSQRMVSAFMDLPICKHVYPSETNFLLVKFENAQAVYKYLSDRGIMVKDCSCMPLCENCLRITIGSKPENNELLSALRQY